MTVTGIATGDRFGIALADDGTAYTPPAPIDPSASPTPSVSPAPVPGEPGTAALPGTGNPIGRLLALGVTLATAGALLLVLATCTIRSRRAAPPVPRP